MDKCGDRFSSEQPEVICEKPKGHPEGHKWKSSVWTEPGAMYYVKAKVGIRKPLTEGEDAP
jgi:hypothetical protein